MVYQGFFYAHGLGMLLGMANENSKPEPKPEQPPTKNKGGRRSKLAILLEDTPDKYSQLLQWLRLGATIVSCCSSLGIDQSTFARWINRGRDATKGKYRQFYLDIMAAVGHASVIVETQIKIDNPMAWLKNGPRRLLGDEWRDDPGQSVSVSGTIEHEHEHAAIPYDGKAPATSQDLAAALIELSNAGLVVLPSNASPLLGKPRAEPIVEVIVEGGASSNGDLETEKKPPKTPE